MTRVDKTLYVCVLAGAGDSDAWAEKGMMLDW